jgi:2-methylisocitrate lyase-like PEP mutase family enzyme
VQTRAYVRDGMTGIHSPMRDASAPDQHAMAEVFRDLHAHPGAFVIPNPWDAGTARILSALGFEALATTSAGLAFALRRRDGEGATGGGR